MTEQMNFSDLLIKFRERKGYTKTDLAKKAGLTLTSITRYEDHNSSKRPSKVNLDKICAILELNDEERSQLLTSSIVKQMNSGYITQAEVESVSKMIQGALAPMFDEQVIEIILEKEMLKILQQLLNMSPEKRKEALKNLGIYMKGFSS